jgi:hypothetical protein
VARTLGLVLDDLRFGDFEADAKTDMFSARGGKR